MTYIPGTILLSKYRIEALCGRGAFAEVYYVTHLELNAPRAIKVLQRAAPGLSNMEYHEFERRFRLEAQLGAQIDHPHVIRVYDFEKDGDTLLLVMEYAAGGSLAEKLRQAREQKQPLSIAESLRIASEVAEGLAQLHALDAVHRDLKPSNILFDSNGQTKVSDLGLVQILDSPSLRSQLSQVAPHPGTPAYMSPEQVNSREYLTSASDIYALGLVLFEMLAGKSYKSCHPGTQLRKLREDIPGWLNKLLAKILSPDPARRPANGAMLVSLFIQHAPPRYFDKLSLPAFKNTNYRVVIGSVLLTILFLIGAWKLYPGIQIDFPASLTDDSDADNGVVATPVRMSGDFRVAVAEFDVIGNPANPSLGKELADCVYQRLVQTFAEAKLDFSIVVWGPDKVRSVSGITADERALDAQNLASALGADILVYSTIDVTQPVWQVQPEFLITSESFYQAAELNGPAQLGAAFTVTGMGEIAQRLEFSTRMTPRVNILAHITVGLAYISAKNYPVAIRELQAIEALPEWEVYNSKEVLYLLVGNAALLAQDIPLAESYFLKSLDANPEYARAMIGLGGVYYLQALTPFDASKNPADTDMVLLQRSIETFLQASRASDQPPLADIPAKVHYGLGQGYFMLVYSGYETSFDAAANEFKAVIDSYGDGTNPRIREIAAESHARLGLIYSLTGNDELVSSEYARAAALLFDDPVRSELYQKRSDETR
ncbi:MAG: protein kinase [Anaerolineales bacterium]|jgi:serine/threonine-protein kinase|nr:protein kinase [Anaerolineales bacterium]